MTPAILSRDTTLEAENIQLALWRQMTPQRKAQLAAGLCRAAAIATWRGIRLRRPNLSDMETHHHRAVIWLGKPLPFEATSMSYEIDPYTIVRPILAALEQVGARTVIVGSLASIIYGEIRLTQDGDLLADLRPDQVNAFVQAIRKAYYVDEGAVRDAVSLHRSFNVIHLETAFKVDVFIPEETPFAASQFQRRQQIEGIGPVASVEDILLAKLRWYRMGGDVSDSQWRDVLALIRLNDDLDQAYLQQWAASLNVADLLTRVMKKARPPDPSE